MRALGIWIGAGDERRGFFGNDVVNDADDTRVGGIRPDGVRVETSILMTPRSGARGDRGEKTLAFLFFFFFFFFSFASVVASES